MYSQAYLTSGIDDPENQGVLRLTGMQNGRMGGARSSLSFDKGDGIVIDFAINSWGGTGADGMAFFMYDANTDENNFFYGGAGSTFGYFNGTAGGLSGGVLAIGFDEYGDFGVTAGGVGSNPGSILLVGESTDTTSGPLFLATGYDIDAPLVNTRPTYGETGHHEGTILLQPNLTDPTLSEVSLYLTSTMGQSTPVFTDDTPSALFSVKTWSRREPEVKTTTMKQNMYRLDGHWTSDWYKTPKSRCSLVKNSHSISPSTMMVIPRLAMKNCPSPYLGRT